MNNFLGLHISQVAEHIRQLGVQNDPSQDSPDLQEDPEWDSTVWFYANDGIAFSFVAQDGGQFEGDFIVEAVLLAGKQVRAFPLYSGDEPTLQPTSLPPYSGLTWGASESEVVAALGEPASRSHEGFRYDFSDAGYSVLFAFQDGQMTSVRYQQIA